MIYFNRLILTFLIIVSCGTGKLKLLCSINNSLKEVSASELVKGSDLVWVIEDNGNKDHLYGLTFEGKIKSSINIKNAKNEDWEDLTSDNEGNIYIGDFGNNRKKRKDFTIYKILHKDLIKDNAMATQIEFKLPKKEKSKDFEAFFLLNDHFYIFSKERTNTHVYKIPNKEGKHEAELVTKYKFDSKNIRITSADIASDGSIILLNHTQSWLLTDYPEDQFFSGTIEILKFNHNSQKEGICFFPKEKNVLISDERTGSEGGNFYLMEFKN